MENKIRFYKDEQGWFADLPDYIEAGGTKEECQMIYGADSFLDILSEGKDEVTLLVSTEPLPSSLIKIMEDEDGAIYNFEKANLKHTLWLCPVTKFVFGNFPLIIYFKVL